jgi:hypothetical protein
MLTQREKDFIKYWETNRLRRKKTVRQFLIGIPVGLLFVIPIAINFASGWYKRAQMEANNGEFNPLVLMIAFLLIIAFTAIFYQKHQWDQHEQRYHELLARGDQAVSENLASPKDQTSDPGPNPSALQDQNPPPPAEMHQKSG